MTRFKNVSGGVLEIPGLGYVPDGAVIDDRDLNLTESDLLEVVKPAAKPVAKKAPAKAKAPAVQAATEGTDK